MADNQTPLLSGAYDKQDGAVDQSDGELSKDVDETQTELLPPPEFRFAFDLYDHVFKRKTWKAVWLFYAPYVLICIPFIFNLTLSFLPVTVAMEGCKRGVTFEEATSVNVTLVDCIEANQGGTTVTIGVEGRLSNGLTDAVFLFMFVEIALIRVHFLARRSMYLLCFGVFSTETRKAVTGPILVVLLALSTWASAKSLGYEVDVQNAESEALACVGRLCLFPVLLVRSTFFDRTFGNFAAVLLQYSAVLVFIVSRAKNPYNTLTVQFLLGAENQDRVAKDLGAVRWKVSARAVAQTIAQYVYETRDECYKHCASPCRMCTYCCICSKKTRMRLDTFGKLYLETKFNMDDYVNVLNLLYQEGELKPLRATELVRTTILQVPVEPSADPSPQRSRSSTSQKMD